MNKSNTVSLEYSLFTEKKMKKKKIIQKVTIYSSTTYNDK